MSTYEKQTAVRRRWERAFAEWPAHSSPTGYDLAIYAHEVLGIDWDAGDCESLGDEISEQLEYGLPLRVPAAFVLGWMWAHGLVV